MENQGKKWSQVDKDYLLKQVKLKGESNEVYEQIAKELKRTVRGCKGLVWNEREKNRLR